MKTTFLILASLATITSSKRIKPIFLTDEYIYSLNEKQSTWTAGRNFPQDTPIEELMRLSGAILDYDDEIVIGTPFLVTDEEIPEHFDARERWPECQTIREIRNQGRCGSCWAFAAVEAMSDRFCIITNGQYIKFSAENLISCCRNCGTCVSGGALASWQYWVTNGIVSGGDYASNQGCQPYGEGAFRNATTPTCRETCTNDEYLVPFAQDKHFGLNTYAIYNDVQGIQADIMKNGPVEAFFNIYQDFYSYKSGVYRRIDEKLVGGHYVKIIGWGTENGTPYWLVANSWGAHWGDLGGFVKILRGSNHCNIESQINAGIPKL